MEKYDKEIADGSINPRDLKMKLAHTITAEYHGNDGADKAQEEFINVVSNKGIPEDIEEIKVENGKSVFGFDCRTRFYFKQRRSKKAYPRRRSKN